ncbi:MAG TPA: TspO/MBR family protein [Longimicrobiales bacterium]
MNRRDLLGLVVALAVCFGAAAVGAQFMPGPWYDQLAKPAWTPPGAVFGPVWTVLYALMAVAAWLVWKRRRDAPVGFALAMFALQLVLNAAWSWLFFGLERPDLALVDIAVLWCAILVTTIAFWRVRPVAGGLLLPYIAWVTFAAALNWQIWQLN